MMFNFIVVALIVIIGVVLIIQTIALRGLFKRSKRSTADINSLHHNQGVLLSSVNELAKELRRHEKSAKIIKRNIRSIRRPEGEEESGGE